jgi:hypothetical protein
MNTATVADVFSPSQTRKYVRRWRELQNNQVHIDHETAALCGEIRELFPDGASGNQQFRKWVAEHFEVGGGRARRLQYAAQAIRLYPDILTWKKIGGWQSVIALLGFAPKARNKILKATLEDADHKGVFFTSSHTVRRFAADYGFETTSAAGRPTRTETENALVVLRSFIGTLYKSMKGLPPIPGNVLKALKSSKLADFAEEIRQAK